MFYRRKLKFNNVKQEYDGKKFDSIKEKNRYQELVLIQRSGKIENLQHHVRFELIPKFEKDGVKYRATNYEADFVYTDGGRQVVEDVKSPVTKSHPVYVMKKKLLLLKYPNITFLET